VLPAPVAQIVPDPLPPYCQGDVVTLFAAGLPLDTYVWSTGETGQSIEVTASGVYTVTVSNLFGCSSESTLPVGFLPTPTADVTVEGPASLCEGNQVTLTASGLPFVNTFEWNTGESTQSISVSQEGAYSVTVTNLAGCSATSDAVDITVIPGPTADAGPDVVICLGDTAQLIAAGGQNYIWTLGGNGPQLNVSPPDDSMYVVEVTNDGCDQVATDTVWVFTQDYPNAAFGYGSTDLGEPVEFSDSSTVQPLFSWEWDFGDGGSSNVQNPSHDYAEAGNYTVTLVVSTSAGCSDTVSAVLNVEEFFIITNVLTPNGDGSNDYIWITSSLASRIEAKIYNRWGVSVWEGVGKDLRFSGKTNAGVDLPSGTYYYTVSLYYGDAETKDKTGYITLIR